LEALRHMPDHLLRDIGISRFEVDHWKDASSEHRRTDAAAQLASGDARRISVLRCRSI
jgi:hypothetical protein